MFWNFKQKIGDTTKKLGLRQHDGLVSGCRSTYVVASQHGDVERKELAGNDWEEALQAVHRLRDLDAAIRKLLCLFVALAADEDWLTLKKPTTRVDYVNFPPRSNSEGEGQQLNSRNEQALAAERSSISKTNKNRIGFKEQTFDFERENEEFVCKTR